VTGGLERALKTSESGLVGPREAFGARARRARSVGCSSGGGAAAVATPRAWCDAGYLAVD
jgi:hypothetical protein